MERFWQLRALRRFWWVIAAAVIVAMGAAWVVTEAEDEVGPPRKTFEATTTVYSTGGVSDLVRGDTLTDPDLVVLFLESDEVAGPAQTSLGFSGTLQQLTAMVVGTVGEGTPLIEITATSADPQLAADVSRAFADALLLHLTDLRHVDNLEKAEDVQDAIRLLRSQIKETTEPTELASLDTQLDQRKLEKTRLLETADPGFDILSSQTTPKPVDTTGFEAPRSLAVRLGIALALGLVGGMAIALVIGRVDTRIRTKRGAEDRFGLPVLAEIPVLPRKARAELITASEPDSRYAEGFRILGAELVRGPRPYRGSGNGGGAKGFDKAPQVFVVTSAGPGEGKTTVAANLAVALADTERSVVVLSCDFRRPKIHSLFGVEPTPGLAEALTEENNGRPILDRVAVQTKVDGVRLVPSGRVRSQPSELLNSPDLRRLIGEARLAADIVIVDTTPILAVSDAAFIAPEADAVLLVARSGRTTGEVAERTTELLARLGCPAIGVALNRAAETVFPKGYRAYYERRPEWATPNAGNGDPRPEEASERAETVVVGEASDDLAVPDRVAGDSPTSHVTHEGDNV